MTQVIIVSDRDNVATAIEPLEPGASIAAAGAVTVVDRIPRGHKVAIRAIAAGSDVIKYGSPIGTASADIRAGAHVHTHNLASTRGRGDLAAARPSDPLLRIAEPQDLDG